jgi:hypothetical protein
MVAGDILLLLAPSKIESRPFRRSAVGTLEERCNFCGDAPSCQFCMQVAEAKKFGDIGECENEAAAKVRHQAEIPL